MKAHVPTHPQLLNAHHALVHPRSGGASPASLVAIGMAMAMLAACGGPSDDNEPPGGTPGLPPDTSQPGGPNIISVSLNSTTLYNQDTAVITAIVTDPDGIEDVIGGELATTDGAVLRAFATASQEGAYSATLTWQDIQVAHDITAVSGATQLTLIARFYDQSAKLSTKSFVLQLACSDDDRAACSGACVDLDHDENNCGACGNDIGSATCSDGAPSCGAADYLYCSGDCGYIGDPSDCGACGNSCPTLQAQTPGAIANACVSPAGDFGCAVSMLTQTTGQSCLARCNGADSPTPLVCGYGRLTANTPFGQQTVTVTCDQTLANVPATSNPSLECVCYEEALAD